MHASYNQVRMASIIANILVTTIITFKLWHALPYSKLYIVIMTMEANVDNAFCN